MKLKQPWHRSVAQYVLPGHAAHAGQVLLIRDARTRLLGSVNETEAESGSHRLHEGVMRMTEERVYNVRVWMWRVVSNCTKVDLTGQ